MRVQCVVEGDSARRDADDLRRRKIKGDIIADVVVMMRDGRPHPCGRYVRLAHAASYRRNRTSSLGLATAAVVEGSFKRVSDPLAQTKHA